MQVQDILEGLENTVINGDRIGSIKFARESLNAEVKVLDAINQGLIKGMTIVGEKYAKREYFLPQVLRAANAMYGGLDILLPHIPKEDAGKMIVCIIGTVEGDVHDIGKNIVKTMLTAVGLDMHDLGTDVPIEDFVNSVNTDNAKIIAMSTLMTPTMDLMKVVVDGLIESGDRAKVKIVIGGAPTSETFAEEIGADLYASDAQEAASKIKRFM